MKKVILSAVLLCGISFASNASVATTTKVAAPQKSAVKVKKVQMYCQGVQFTHAYVQVCGETWAEYVDCLREAIALFD